MKRLVVLLYLLCHTIAFTAIIISLNNNGENGIRSVLAQDTLSNVSRSPGEHDSVTILMDGKTIPGKGFIHLYDSTPSTILTGHLAAHLPCNTSGNPSVEVVGGVAPNVSPLNLTLVDALSAKGSVCMYHTDLPQQENITEITDIALLNPTGQNITLPDTTSIAIHVSEFNSGATHD